MSSAFWPTLKTPRASHDADRSKTRHSPTTTQVPGPEHAGRERDEAVRIRR